MRVGLSLGMLSVLALILIGCRHRSVTARAKEAFLAHDCEKAISLYTEAIAQSPDDPTFYMNRSSCLSDLGRTEAALKDESKAMEIALRLTRGREGAPFAPFFYNSGVTRERAGDRRGAIAAYQHALQLDPTYPDAANNLAWTFATSTDDTLRDPKRAITLAEDECARDVQENPSHLGTLAAAYAAAGDFDKAIATQKKAIERLSLSDRADAERFLAQFEKKEALRIP